MARFSGLYVVLCAAALLSSGPAHAGFEFKPAPAAASTPVATDQPAEAPMPLLPAAPVAAMPLVDAPASALEQPAASPPAQASSGDQVYIRRQRTTSVIKAPVNEPMDTDALLKATENGESVALTKERLDRMPAKQSGKLVINPYPLEETATHDNGGMGTLSVEQAMMEEGGTLRPVAVPGKNSAQGLRARARLTSRYDSGSSYLDRSGMTARADAAVTDPGMLTPIPGGEGEPLMPIEAMPLNAPDFAKEPAAPAPSVAAAAVPRAPDAAPAPAASPPAPMRIAPDDAAPPAAQPAQAANAQPEGFTDAVGFGRDLPLALALSQVVPPQYSYAFGQDVNVGTTVSWQGGKPWNQVLDDMLARNGMRAVIQGQQVTIQNRQS